MRSLRTTVLSGFVILGASLIFGFAGVVYARSSNLAHSTMQDELAFRADTLAGLLEMEDGDLEFDVPPAMLEDFKEEGSGSYLLIVDVTGKVRVESPNMAGKNLPAPPAWEEGNNTYSEVVEGPDGIPCAVVSRSFLAHVDGSQETWEADGLTYPTTEMRKFRIQVALDSRPRDQGLADLGAFLLRGGFVALILTVLAALFVTRTVLRPIHRMTAEAESLTPEDATRRLHPDTVVRELHALSDTLNSALDRLGEALTRQRQFTSDASHELRTPVAVLMSNAEHLLRKPRSARDYQEGLKRQQRIAERMKGITENLLLLARGDAESAAIERRPLNLDDIAITVAGDYESLASEKGIRIVCAPEDEVPVRGDPRYLAQLVANLVSNAVKFTPEGGTVTVRAAAENGTASLWVEDSGHGIPPEHMNKIFDRFYRVEEGRHRAEGAGLGLAIVNWIVKAHDGELTVKSQPGAGTTFRVDLATDSERMETKEGVLA